MSHLALLVSIRDHVRDAYTEMRDELGPEVAEGADMDMKLEEKRFEWIEPYYSMEAAPDDPNAKPKGIRYWPSLRPLENALDRIDRYIDIARRESR